jgi:small GTP-binding protein
MDFILERHGQSFMKRVRAVFCGEALVGKSSIIHRFCTERFIDLKTTVAGAFHSACVKVADQTVSMELWDTAGSERYHSVIPAFFRGACAVVVVYDVTSRESFDRTRYWFEFARVHSPDTCKVFLVGNKIDLSRTRAVSFEEGAQCSKDHRLAGYTETSAKSGEAIDILFALLAHLPGDGFGDVAVSGPVRKLQDRPCCSEKMIRK